MATRLARGVGALAALLLGLVGVPLALVLLGGDPFPTALSWPVVRRALLTPDDGSVLLGLIAIVGWLAWLVFAASVASELIGLASHRRVRIRLPGLVAPQRLAAGLLVAVIAMLSVPQVAQGPPPAVGVGVVAPEVVVAHARPAAEEPKPAEPAALAVSAAGASAPVPAPGVTHVVKVGDDLWSLAEHYYGKGQDWRRIATANPKVLTGGPDRLQPGWQLHIPDVDEPAVPTGGRAVTVRRGDTLSVIAARELGSASAWPRIFRLNRSQLDDPDELVVGMRLALPGAAARTTAALHEGARTPAASGQPGVERPEPKPIPDPAEPGLPPSGLPPSVSIPRSEDPVPGPPTTQALSTSSPGVPAPGGADAGFSFTAPLAGVGGLLAAGLLAGLVVRRRSQLQLRPVGRRIAQPPPAAQAVEAALGNRQRPLSLRTLDRAARAIAAHCRRTGDPLPPLRYALVGETELELVLAQHRPDAPVGFTVRGRSWRLGQADAGYLSSVPGLADALRPWPGLVTLGRDDQDRLVVGDLEGMGLLQLQSAESDPSGQVLAAMAVELSFSPWADEMSLSLVGGFDRLPEALGKHNVTRTDDLDELLTRLEQRAIVQRAQQPQSDVEHRIDPDLADPWAPEIVLVSTPISADQRRRLEGVVLGAPRVTVAAVIVDPRPSAPWSLRLTGSGAASAVLEPVGLQLSPQHLDRPAERAVVDLIEVTGSVLTTPARWWAEAGVPPDPPPDNITPLGSWLGDGGTDGDQRVEGLEMRSAGVTAGREVRHPTLQLLGPIELLGATGSPPPRAGKQCLEYCGWLLENPGTSAQAMAAALIVAEGTRRSNMSRLRGWLGSSPAGEPYLPDAYTGRISLHPWVSSDWQRLQLLTAGGVNRASADRLHGALDLVRGAPLADAAPGQWHWAEELRTDMISCLRDVGVELTTQALERGDIDLARWAASRALVAAPGDELLLAARIRTEHLAGNPVETERLTLQLAAQARALGVDLDSETVVLLQQVMEGRVRARMA